MLSLNESYDIDIVSFSQSQVGYSL